MIHPFFEGLRAPLHISHRGGAKLAPENTLEAFQQAVSFYGTDVIELDLQRTKDGVLVVSHDPTVDRCTNGHGEISSLTRVELSKLDAGFHFQGPAGTTPFRAREIHIPTFVEVLRALPRTRLNVELKCAAPEAPEELARLLREENAIARVCIGSENDSVAEQLRSTLPEACFFYPRNAAAAFVMAVKSGEPPPVEDRYQVLELPLDYEGVPLFDAELAKAAAKAGKWINIWTVDKPEEMRALLANKVGGIMTDRPDVLRHVLDEPRSA